MLLLRIAVSFGLLHCLAGLWWALHRPLTFDPVRICRRARRIKGHMPRVCRDWPVVKALADGALMGVYECQHQMKDSRWNCSTTRRSLDKMLARDTRESALVQAITSAGAVHKLARMCSAGVLFSCSCRRERHAYQYDSNAKQDPSVMTALQFHGYSGCGDNVNFGVDSARSLFDADIDGRVYGSVRAAVLNHNNDAGRKAVLGHMSKKCKCHGPSGSCSFQSCFHRVRPFPEIGIELREKYQGAKPVAPGNDHPDSLWSSVPYERLPAVPSLGTGRDSNHRHGGVKRRSIPGGELIFTERSPNFCQRDRKRGVLSPKGRPCSLDVIDEGSCNYLCCGRGYEKSNTEVTESNCNCKFKWCCEVICETCRNLSTTYRCR